MLQHHHVALSFLVLHLLLEGGAQGVERVTAGGDFLVGEEPDPTEAVEDAVLLFGGGELRAGADGPDDAFFLVVLGADDLGGGFAPGDGGALAEVVLGVFGEEADVHEGLDVLWEPAVAQGTADDGLRLGDLVALLVGGGVAVGVSDEGETGVDEVGLCFGHELRAVDILDAAVLPPLRLVAEGEQHAAGAPRELVAQRVIRGLGGGEPTAVRLEGEDLAACLVDVVDGDDGREVVDAGVDADLVEDGDAGFLALGVEGLHGGGDVGSSDYVLLLADGGLDDGGVVGVGDQADDKVDLCDLRVESVGVGDIEADGGGVADAFCEGLGLLESAAGDGDLDA